jgi:hypothetical protein
MVANPSAVVRFSLRSWSDWRYLELDLEPEGVEAEDE